MNLELTTKLCNMLRRENLRLEIRIAELKANDDLPLNVNYQLQMNCSEEIRDNVGWLDKANRALRAM